MKYYSALLLEKEKRSQHGPLDSEGLSKLPHFSLDALVWEYDGNVADGVPARFLEAFGAVKEEKEIPRLDLTKYIVEPIPSSCSKCHHFIANTNATPHCQFYDTAVRTHDACLGLQLLSNWKMKGIQVASDFDEEVVPTKGRPKLKR